MNNMSPYQSIYFRGIINFHQQSLEIFVIEICQNDSATKLILTNCTIFFIRSVKSNHWAKSSQTTNIKDKRDRKEKNKLGLSCGKLRTARASYQLAFVQLAFIEAARPTFFTYILKGINQQVSKLLQNFYKPF